MKKIIILALLFSFCSSQEAENIVADDFEAQEIIYDDFALFTHVEFVCLIDILS